MNNAQKESATAGTGGAQDNDLLHRNSTPIVFPVKVEWDEDRTKWTKRPDTGGQSWKNYQPVNGELARADNTGVVVPAGYIVIDIDTQHGATRDAIAEALGCEPAWGESLLQSTPSGGEHHGFRLPDGATARQGESLLGVKGFDTRVTGKGWIATGKGYEDDTVFGISDPDAWQELPTLPDAAVSELTYQSKEKTAPAAAQDVTFDLDTVISDETQEELRDALTWIDPDGRGAWADIGQALVRLGDVGYDIWYEWSQRGEKWDSEKDVPQWRSFRGDHTTYQAVFAKAQRAGWTNPRKGVKVDADGDNWPGGLNDKTFTPFKNYRNTKAALQNFGVVCSYDEFKDEHLIAGTIPGDAKGRLEDKSLSLVRDALIQKYAFEPTKEMVADTLMQRCLEGAYDPVLDYFNGLQWDGTPRVERFLTDYLGAEDNPTNRAISQCFLTAIVRRARHPGCKFDSILVLEGKQGTGKSTALKILAGEEYFNDSNILNLKGGDQVDAIKGYLIHEIADLEGFRKADIEALKAFVSRSVDRGRKAYDRFRTDLKRRCVFTATTNEDAYLLDPTGNRRYWPVATGAIDLEAMRRDVDQILAEAAVMESAGSSVVVPDHLLDALTQLQASRVEDDPWIEILQEFPGYAYTHDGERYVYVTTSELFERLGVTGAAVNNHSHRRLKEAMRALGWERPTFAFWAGDERVRGYRRKCDSPMDGLPPATEPRFTHSDADGLEF